MFNVEKLFGKSTRGKRLKGDDRIPGDLPFVTAGESNEGVSAFIGNDVTIFSKNTTTIDMFGSAKYRNYKYGADDHVAVVHTEKLSRHAAIFITSAIHKSSCTGIFDYGRNFYAKDADRLNIYLPSKNNDPDYEFMENYIAELEAYLTVAGLKDYELTPQEQKALDEFENYKFSWGNYNIKSLFGASTRGKRLKSADRLSGYLPFVTAGESNEGVSAFIGNDVTVFSANTTTIDMFGSAKYRNYEYGADDHVAVVHTENLPKHAAIFVTTAIHKSSYTGKFDYGRNFYAKDADELMISLPSKNNKPDYSLMATLISAIQKLVIKDVVLFSERKITAHKQVVKRGVKHLKYCSNPQ